MTERKDSIEFGTLSEEGGYEHTRTLSKATILECPHLILVPEHYREDGTCRCTDPTHTEMAEWGYAWSNGHWGEPESEIVDYDV